MSNKKIVPKDYTVLSEVPACHVYTIEYVSERQMTEDERDRLSDVMAESGMGEVLFVKAIANTFDEACSILRRKAQALKGKV